MSDLSKATPRPWSVERHDQEDGSINYELWSIHPPEVYHRILTISDDDDKAARINAALIVKAVNLHEDLIAALRRYLEVATAFRSKPVGAPGSVARMMQDEHIALEDRVKAILAMAGVP